MTVSSPPSTTTIKVKGRRLPNEFVFHAAVPIPRPHFAGDPVILCARPSRIPLS
jgi:hypothetical protein